MKPRSVASSQICSRSMPGAFQRCADQRQGAAGLDISGTEVDGDVQ